jgi:uncharacterized OB-fold protein
MQLDGKLYTYSVINVASVAFQDKVPYLVGIIETEKERFLTYISGYHEQQEIHIGADMVFDYETENGYAVYKFKKMEA